MRAYSELYLSDAKNNMAAMFDYAVNECELNGDVFAELFIQSGYAEQFERGNPAVLSGMSGVEAARRVINYAYPEKSLSVHTISPGRSPEYWAGWALAEYQWATAKRFKDIFIRAPFSEVVEMYSLYHEMDISRFIEEMDNRYSSVKTETKLKTIRENRGVSQAELAESSGVNLRSIQMYEQRVNEIDKAQAKTLYKLSRVLGCTVEDLLENPNE